MAAILYNKEFPVHSGVSFPHDTLDGIVNWKYGAIDTVYESAKPIIRALLDQAPIQGRHKRVLVDVKVQHLTPEKCSCIPGWHCDGVLDPLHSSNPEVFHLFVWGGAPTEFIACPIILKWEHGYSLADLQKQIKEDIETCEIPLGMFNTYGRFDFHRGVHADKVLTRLLVRITETDVIHPIPHPRMPMVQ